MKLIPILILYLSIHIILCVAGWILLRCRILKCSEQLLPVALLVPFFGMILLLLAEIFTRCGKTGSKALALEELHLDGDDLKLLNPEQDRETDNIIPLEEALAINDAMTRRKLMLEILRQNPEEYISLLQDARMDSDIEVNHYASTAIMEISRDYDLALQKAEQNYRDTPDDPGSLEQYIKGLKRYIDSGLINKNVLFVYRYRLSELFEVQMDQSPENIQSHVQAVQNYISSRNYTRAMELLERMLEKWPRQESVWLAKLQLHAEMRDSAGIKAVLAEIRSRNIYLSPEGRSIVGFWEEKKEAGIYAGHV